MAGTALYLTTLALLSLFSPLIVWPMLPESIGDWFLRVSPMTAGLAVQRTVERADSAPIGEWAGLGVAGLWAAAAPLLAFWLIVRRDA